ncbi:hypothetical protein BGW41_006433 [Actinomortierella wolfii]|nr:hypothetical protein BGW41_006433 [Actinomortierella wolfii]
MITFHSGTTFAYKYSVDTDSWSHSLLRVDHPDYQGVNAVTDPSTGLVYLAAGYSSINWSNLDVYDFAIDSIRTYKLPPANEVFEARSYYANVYSKTRSSILYFGGYSASFQTVENAVISEYVPSTQMWSTLKTTGTGPSTRADHCMAINDDGTKVIVYGGRLPSEPRYSGDIFILDLNTTSWTKGLAGPNRLYASCVIAGDLFILWGGDDGEQTVGYGATLPPLIYNMTANRWVTKYVPPVFYRSNSGDGTNVEKTTKSNVGAIAGSIAAAVVVVAAIAILIFMRRRKATKNTGQGSGTQYTYAAVEHQDPPPINYGNALVLVSMAAPAPVSDAKAQIFNPSHNPVKAMMVSTSDIPLHPETFISHSKDYSVGGNTGKSIDYPLSTMNIGSSVSRLRNPQAIVAIPESHHRNPQAVLELQQQHPR